MCICIYVSMCVYVYIYIYIPGLYTSRWQLYYTLLNHMESIIIIESTIYPLSYIYIYIYIYNNNNTNTNNNNSRVQEVLDGNTITAILSCTVMFPFLGLSC